jgi:DNA repair protein RadA/Sms
LGLRLSDQDLYINVAGGIRIAEVGAELALAAAIYSARTGLPLPVGMAIAGELSLTGEIRPVRRLPGRIKTAKNLGFTRFLGPLPEGRDPDAAAGGTEAAAVSEEFQGIRDIKAAIRLIFGGIRQKTP